MFVKAQTNIHKKHFLHYKPIQPFSLISQQIQAAVGLNILLKDTSACGEEARINPPKLSVSEPQLPQTSSWGVVVVVVVTEEGRGTAFTEAAVFLFLSSRQGAELASDKVRLYHGSRLAWIATPCGANVTLEWDQMALLIGKLGVGGGGRFCSTFT